MVSAKMQMLLDLSDKLFNSKLAKMQGKFNKRISKMQSKFRDFTNEIPGMGRALDVLTNKWVLLGVGVVGMGVMLSKSVKAAEKFDSAFLNIRQLNLDKSKTELDSYRKEIRNASIDIGSNLVESTNAMYDLQSATGVYGADAIEIFKKVGKYSFSTGANLNDTMNSTTKAMKAFGLEVKDIDELLNSNAKTVQDEVWLFSHDTGYQTNYIKYFKNKAIVVNTRINMRKESLIINTWFLIKGEDTRKGIKIK